VRNRGIVVIPADAKDIHAIYVRTAPVFDAAIDGPYAWLNKALFLGTLQLSGPKLVRIRMYKVL
jgi:hypothetical protein